MNKDLKRILRSLENYKENTVETLAQEMEKASNSMKSDMEQMSPVRTGALKASITAKKQRTKDRIKTGADYGMLYGGYVEKWVPYIRPAFAKNYEKLEAIKEKIKAR